MTYPQPPGQQPGYQPPTYQPPVYPQPGYQQPYYQGGYQQPPNYPQPYPPFGPPQPSGVTAIISGVLATIGGIVQLLGGFGSVIVGIAGVTDSGYGVESKSWYQPYAVISGLVALVVAGLLLAGAILLFIKRPLGRLLVIAGCATTVVAGIVNFVVNLAGAPGAATLLGGGIGMLFLIFPLATLVLAALPSTAKWCTAVGQNR